MGRGEGKGVEGGRGACAACLMSPEADGLTLLMTLFIFLLDISELHCVGKIKKEFLSFFWG